MESARIVVGVDGTGSSRQALRWGAALAGATGAALEAVTAWHPDPSTWATEGWIVAGPMRDCEEEAARVLAEEVETALGPGADVTRHVVEGAPAHVLLEASEGALVLVVGSRGYGGLRGIIHRSVSVPCAERARCPVLVVHGDHAPPRFGAAATRALVG